VDPFQRAVFGHGEPIDNGASQAIAKLAGSLSGVANIA
jgi:hypothetical protein